MNGSIHIFFRHPNYRFLSVSWKPSIFLPFYAAVFSRSFLVAIKGVTTFLLQSKEIYGTVQQKNRIIWFHFKLPWWRLLSKIRLLDDLFLLYKIY